MLRFKQLCTTSKKLIKTHQTSFVQGANLQRSLQSQISSPLYYRNATLMQHQMRYFQAQVPPQDQASIILQKTQRGRDLAHRIGKDVQEDSHRKLQRYNMFVNKMDQLYRSESNFRKKQQELLHKMKMVPVYSQEPLKDILRYYNSLSERGFDAEAVSETLKSVIKALKSKGNNPLVGSDYSTYELFQSWRMQKLIDDVKFALRSDQFFNPHYFAQINRLLGELGYKNTEIIPLVFQKINAQLEEKENGRQNEQEVTYENTVYGDRKNFQARSHIYTGFQDSSEFKEYLQILLEWEGNDKEQIEYAQTAEQTDQEIIDIENSIRDVIDAATQIKASQSEYQASIESLRQQYFQMQMAADKHKFLEENLYIKYDLLELQERLVSGGFLDPEEVGLAIHEEPFVQRMNRASEVFYDYVLNYSPELLSPQHDSFLEIAEKSKPNKIEAAIADYTDHNFINLSYLSQSLIGLANQAMSYQRDVCDRDYLHEHYRQLLMPDEHRNPDPDSMPIQYTTVMMERHYLKGWKQFQAYSSKLLPQLMKFIQEEPNNVEGQLYALQAINQCRLDMPQIKEQIIKNCLNGLELNSYISTDAAIEGLRGLALQCEQGEQTKTLVPKLMSQIDISVLNFEQKLDTLWVLCMLQQYDNELCRGLVREVNRLSFDRVDHDLNYEQYQKLMDIFYALKWEVPESEFNEIETKLINNAIIQAEKGKEMLEQRFSESKTHYDPFKSRVVQALSLGLTQSSIDHQTILEKSLYENQHMDIDKLKTEFYPYKPDIVMGYKGTKIGLFVLGEDLATTDTNKATGLQKFRMRVLEKASQGELKAVSISVPKVVSYDIEGLKISLNENFKFIQELDSQLRLDNNQSIQKYQQNFDELSLFGAKMMREISSFTEKINSLKDVQLLESFVRGLMNIFQLKSQVDLKYDPEVKSAGYDEIRFQLMKLDLQFQRLSNLQQQFINRFLPEAQPSFNKLLVAIKNSVPKVKVDQIDSQDLNTSWQGARLDAEMPVFNTQVLKKSIVPELINQRFMWVNGYFHYQDWKQAQQQVFDNFNLLEIPQKKNQYNFFFDKDNMNRSIPLGVFPFPNHKRVIMQPSANNFALSLAKQQGNDDFTLFEKEPLKLMVVNELKKSDQLQSISNEVSMITNLQNIKQGLKQDFNDKEILDTILLNLSFTDKLIEEHLGEVNNSNKDTKTQTNQTHSPQYVSRDGSEYRRFVESTYLTKDKEDPYTDFFLKEAGKQERAHKLREKREELDIIENSETSNEKVEQIQQQKEGLLDKIDEMLLENEMENEDLMNVGFSHRQNIKITYDLKSLIKSDNIYDVEPELVDNSLNDEQYLALQRRRSETKLIKSKIVYKLHLIEEDQNKYALTQQESDYLKHWLNDLRKNENRNILNLRESLVPKTNHTSLTVNDLNASDLYTLNTISKVEFKRESVGKYSLSDLVLELGHFLDEEVVNKIEMDIFGRRVAQEWDLHSDFKLIETRNKEIGLVLNELEEVAWRTAGRFDDNDLDVVTQMVSIGRNKDLFDKEYYENDMKSLKEFMNDVNDYDNRVKLLELWLVRKEDEYKSRVSLPPAAFKMTDKEIFAKLDKKLKDAREKLVSKFLVSDKLGNAIEDKEYKDLTSLELSQLSEQLALRLYLFNYDYPMFLPQVVKAIIEHPNLHKSDRDLLTTYCKMFEVDWQGDRLALLNNDFMSMVPMYVQGTNLKSYGQITNESVRDKLQRASNPFVSEITNRMLEHA